MSTDEPTTIPDPAQETDRLQRKVWDAYEAAGVDEAVWPTPEQALDAFERMDQETRVYWIGVSIEARQDAMACFHENHRYRIERQNNDLAALVRRLECPHAYIPEGVHHEIQVAEHAARKAKDDGTLSEEHVEALRAAHAKVQQCEVPLDQHWAYLHRNGSHTWSTAPNDTPAALRNAATEVRETFGRLVKVRLHGSDTEQAQAWDKAYLAVEALTEALIGDDADAEPGRT